jgi:hypothetical protein
VLSTLFVLSASFFEGVLQALADAKMKKKSIRRPLVNDLSFLEITIIIFLLKYTLKEKNKYKKLKSFNEEKH